MQIPQILIFLHFMFAKIVSMFSMGALQVDTIKVSLAVSESEAKQAFRSRYKPALLISKVNTWGSCNFLFFIFFNCNTQPSSVSVHWETFQESWKFGTQSVVTVVFIYSKFKKIQMDQQQRYFHLQTVATIVCKQFCDLQENNLVLFICMNQPSFPISLFQFFIVKTNSFFLVELTAHLWQNLLLWLAVRTVLPVSRHGRRHHQDLRLQRICWGLLLDLLQTNTSDTTWLHGNSSSSVLQPDCMGTVLHLCYNLTAWNWQLFTCATTLLQENSSSSVLQLDCMGSTLHLCNKLTARKHLFTCATTWLHGKQLFTCAFSCNWQQGKSARKMATLALSFLFWGAIITVIIVTFRLGHFCTNEESEGLKKSLEVILHQPGDQPTHASHFHWITVKQARPQGLYATLKIVYIQRTNQTSDSKLLPLA